MRPLLPPARWSRGSFRGGAVALFLALSVVLVYPISIGQAGWIAITEHYPWLAAVGLVLGTLAGNSALRRRASLLLGSALGALFVVVFTAMAAGDQSLHAKVSALGTAVNNWLTQVLAGEAGTDPTAFILFLGATVWAAAYLGGFALARYRRPWELVILSGFCLVVNVSLALRPLLLDLVTFSLLSLVLLARLHVVALEERWRRQRLEPSGDMGWRVLRGGLTWTFALILVAFFTPKLAAADTLGRAWNAFEGPWHSVENEWQRFFAGVYGPSRIQGVSFSDVIRLGLAPNLGDRVVMYVQSSEPHFWRATAYDFYTGVGWKSNDDRGADTTTAGNYQARKRLDQTVDVVAPQGTLLFGASEPVNASIPHQFTYGEDRGFSSALRARQSLSQGQRYQVSSAVAAPDKQALRASSTAYPAAITDRYLQLPSTLPQRVRRLAETMAQGKTNPYDKAEAIESFLRTNYRYSTVVKPPPQGQDPVDWFLFNVKEDFCEYFASSMVVMLRDVGVPARVVEGYTAGEFDPTQNRYVVREINAHAWVEVYFTGYGWIEFEPTPSQSVFARPDTATAGQTGSGDTATTPDRPDRQGLGRPDDADTPQPDAGFGDTGDAGTVAAPPPDYRPLAGIFGALLLVLFAAWVRFELRFRGVPAAEAAFGKMRLLATYAGLRQRPHQTPFEYAAVLGRALPRAEDQIATVARAQVLARYAPNGVSAGDAREADRAWRGVAWQILRVLPRRILGLVRGAF